MAIVAALVLYGLSRAAGGDSETSLTRSELSRQGRVMTRPVPPTNVNYKLIDSQFGTVNWDTVNTWHRRAGYVPGQKLFYYVYDVPGSTLKKIYGAPR